MGPDGLTAKGANVVKKYRVFFDGQSVDVQAEKIVESGAAKDGTLGLRLNIGLGTVAFFPVGHAQGYVILEGN